MDFDLLDGRFLRRDFFLSVGGKHLSESEDGVTAPTSARLRSACTEPESDRGPIAGTFPVTQPVENK